MTPLKVKFVRVAAVFVVALSAWSGIWMSGMEKGWAVACSVLGGVMAMLVGAVISGLKYHDDIELLKRLAEERERTYKARMAEMEKVMDRQKRTFEDTVHQFESSTLGLAKAVGDSVALKMAMKFEKRLPSEEHVESVMRDAEAIIAEEVSACERKVKDFSK